jgi:spermidine synthase
LRRLPAFAAFFLSGASSLIFQNIWGRLLHHVFGSTSVAVSTVVTVFMAGLGLGAWVAGRWADRIRHPIITYAFAELGVGAWALMIPVLVDPQGWLATVNEWLRVEMGTGSAGFMIGRFLCVLPILLVPTTLMGASLPLLARHFVQADQRAGAVGSRVGVLYSLNTFGGVTGVLLAGFLLMPMFGVTATNAAAVSFNFLLGLGVLALRGPLLGDTWAPGQPMEFLPKRQPVTGADGSASEAAESGAQRSEAEPPVAESSDPEEDPDAEPLAVGPFARKAAFVAFAVSGAAALCYEVAWTRALAMTIGASVYSFALILATFLIGIASGSATGAAALGTRRHVLLVVSVLSVGLTLLANAMWGVDSGAWTWLLVSAVAAWPIALIWVAVVTNVYDLEPRQTRKLWLLLFVFWPAALAWGARLARSHAIRFSTPVTDPTRPALLILAMPTATSLVGMLLFDGRLPPIVAAVTTAICVFLALMVALRRYPVLQLASIQLFIAGATFVNYVFQDEIPCGFASMVSSIENLPQHVGTVQFFMFLTVALCTLPATLGMGAMFPLTLRVWTAGGRDVARDTGTVYAGNTAGSIVGSWLPGFVLMPMLGLERTLHAGIVLNLGLGLLMLIASGTRTGLEKGREDGTAPEGGPSGARMPLWHAATIYVLAPLIPAVVALLYLGTAHPQAPLRWNLARMTLGVFRVSLAQDACDPESWGRPEIEYYNDGLSTTVSVERWGQHLALKNNGKVDASNGGDMPTQIMVAGYPLLMHPEGSKDQDVAIVGFGSGVTVGAALQFPVDHIDVIELEQSIVEASQEFHKVNHLEYPLDHFPYVKMPRLNVINDDGRNYLASTQKKYDVIISEPSNPWITGVSSLFTTDHFQVTKDRLKPGGVYCQWVQLYELSPENIKTIYRTFASQFEHVKVFAAESGSSDTVLLGSDSPLKLDFNRLQSEFDRTKVRKELDRAHVDTPYDVLARTLLVNKTEVLQYSQIEHRREDGSWQAKPQAHNAPESSCGKGCKRVPAPLNTDDNALIEFSAPRDLIGYERYQGYTQKIYSPSWPYGRVVGHLVGFGEGKEAARRYAELAMSLIAHGRKAEAAQVIERSQQAGQTRKTRIAFEVLSLLTGDEHEPEIHVEPPSPGPQLAEQEARKLTQGFETVKKAVDEGSHAAALVAMEQIPEPVRQHSGPGIRLLHAFLLYKTAVAFPQRYSQAVEILEDLVRRNPDYVRNHPEVYFLLGRCYDADLLYAKALDNMRRYVKQRVVPPGGEDEQGHGEQGDAAPTTDAPGESDKSERADTAEELGPDGAAG